MEVKEKFEALRKIHLQEKRDLETKIIAEALVKFKLISAEICFQFSEENKYLKYQYTRMGRKWHEEKLKTKNLMTKYHKQERSLMELRSFEHESARLVREKLRKHTDETVEEFMEVFK